MSVQFIYLLLQSFDFDFSGELHVAEVISRFTDIEQFQSLLGTLGFRLKSKVWICGVYSLDYPLTIRAKG